MRMALSCQQFGGTFVDAFGSVAAEEPPVIQKESQQVQVPVTDLATQEKVAA